MTTHRVRVKKKVKEKKFVPPSKRGRHPSWLISEPLAVPAPWRRSESRISLHREARKGATRRSSASSAWRRVNYAPAFIRATKPRRCNDAEKRAARPANARDVLLIRCSGRLVIIYPRYSLMIHCRDAARGTRRNSRHVSRHVDRPFDTFRCRSMGLQAYIANFSHARCHPVICG